MYRIYKHMSEARRNRYDHSVFPEEIDFTVGFEFIKDEGRFEKGRPVSWLYYSKPTAEFPNELIAEVEFDDWNFHPVAGVPLQRPFKIYFYFEDGTRSIDYVDKTSSFIKIDGKLNTSKIKAEGIKRRQNVINQLEGDLINAVGVNRVLAGDDQTTAETTAVAWVTALMTKYESSGDIPLYVSSDLVSAINPGGSTLKDKIADAATETTAWLSDPYFDYDNNPTGQTIREFIIEELTDTV